MESDHSQNVPHRTVRRVYPLSVLFFLIAVSAVVVAFLRPIVQSLSEGPVGITEAAMASVGGALAIGCLGGIVGLYHYRRRRGLTWGVFSGLCLGVILGPATLTPASGVPSLVSITLVGSLLLVAISAFFRLSRR